MTQAEATRGGYDTVYQRSSGNVNEWLTLQHTPYTQNQQLRRHVNLGYAQRNEEGPGGLSLEVAFFTYGNATTAAAVPRMGQALYEADGIGMITAPGEQPRAFQIGGSLSFDFANGQFSALMPITTHSLQGLNSPGASGHGVQIVAGGQLSSSSSLFSGVFAVGGGIAGVTGTISGGLYGPDASELGATFFGVMPNGATASGSLTGSANAASRPSPISLLSVAPGNLLYAPGSPGGTMTYYDGGTFRFAENSTTNPAPTFGAADVVASANANFLRYSKIVDGEDVTVRLYKVGSANTELALTYASFGEYSTMVQSGETKTLVRDFFMYGVPTDNTMLALRTGSARYEGVVYGAATNRDLNGTYDVTGTSVFDVSFDSSTMTGILKLQSIPLNGSPSLSLSDATFSGLFRFWGVGKQEATIGSNLLPNMSWNFFGPEAQEIAAAFTYTQDDATTGRTVVTGATVAREK